MVSLILHCKLRLVHRPFFAPKSDVETARLRSIGWFDLNSGRLPLFFAGDLSFSGGYLATHSLTACHLLPCDRFRDDEDIDIETEIPRALNFHDSHPQFPLLKAFAFFARQLRLDTADSIRFHSARFASCHLLRPESPQPSKHPLINHHTSHNIISQWRPR